MDRDAEKPFVVDRANSFPKDRGYPSNGPHDHVVERSTNDSFFADRHLHRQGTGDFENRRPNKRLRYTIPLRRKRRHTGDEEKGFDEKRGNGGHPARPGGERETSRGTAPYLSPDLYEIISTQFWVPDDEGREVVTLTVKDDTTKTKQEKVSYESVWRHIQSEAMTFKQFHKEVMRLPGLEDDDLALAARLLNKVQKTCEKQFVHGRYLKPTVLVYDGADPEETAKDQKTATFVSLPIFTTECERHHKSTKEDESHPVRALLQSRYRLESTRGRDREQVIRKVHSKKAHVVHIPQIWALIINKHTIITCAPLGTSTLRGETIKLVQHSEAQLDEATWSVHFTDARGTVFYLPLRFCKSWFGLVKQIADDCLHDEYNLIRDQLLQNGPLYQLVTDHGVPVTAESWPQMVEREKKEVIRLRLVDNEGKSNRLLVAYCDENGNEIDYDSGPSSDTSSMFSPDGGESDASESSISSLPTFEEVAPAVEKLRNLHEKLEQARSQDNNRGIEALRDHKIPALEKQILELTAEDLDLDRTRRSRPQKRARAILPDVYEGRRGSSYRLYGNSILGATGGPSIRVSSRSRSRSGSRPRYSRGVPQYTQATYDLSSDQPQGRGSAKRPPLAYNRSQSYSQPLHVFEDYSFPRRSSQPARRQSYTRTIPSRLTIPSRTPHSVSRWDTVRSRVFNGPTLIASPTPVSPKNAKNDICYQPSNRQLARSRWEFLRAQILAGSDLGQSNGQANGEISGEPVSPRAREKLASAMKNMFSDQDARPDKLTSKIAKVLDPENSESEAKPKKRVDFAKRNPEPKLKRLIRLAHKEVLSPTSPTMTKTPFAAEIAPPGTSKKTQDLPIFLWSTLHTPADVVDLSLASKATPAGADQSLSEKIPAEINRNTLKVEELILRTVMNEMHTNMKKPKKVSPEYADLYGKIVDRSVADVTSLMATLDTDDNPANEKGNRNMFTSLSSLTSLTISISDLADNPDSAETKMRLKAIRSQIYDVSGQILHAFVPQGYEAPVVSKYWGAIYQIIHHRTRDEAVWDVIIARLWEINDLVRSIQMGVRTDDGSKQARYQIPRALPAAFQHLVMLLVVSSTVSDWSEHSWKQMQTAFDECEGFFIEGRKQLILMIHTDDYRESAGFQAVDSEALLSLVLANLVSHLSTEREFHLTEVYSEYTTRIHQMVRDSASVKVYDDIKLLREELDIIKNTLKQQDETLRDFRTTISYTYGATSLSLSVIDRMLESIEQRIDDFNELQGQAETARFLAAQSISLKAESNNKAIIVFTTVTIVFLPLSFVTSYLGMNTSDIRGMQSTQTLFWAIGAPVAFVVLSAAVFAAFYGTLTQRITGRAWRTKEKSE